MKLKYANFDFTPKSIDENNYSLRAIFSTGDVDRQGEIVDQKGWLLNDYIKNPVVLFGHDHSQPPIGKMISLNYNSEGNLEGEVKFAAAEYPFANVIWNLYKGGYMKAFSVGFSAGKVDDVSGQIILRENTLYEVSTVSIPANAMALAKSKGIDISPLEEKIEQIDHEAESHHTKECKNFMIEVKDCTDCQERQAARQREREAAAERSREESTETVTPKEEEKVETKAVEEEVVEEKGAIADEVNLNEVAEAKYQRMDEVYEITCALWSVYMDEATPLESFSTLVAESASLLQTVALNNGTTDDITMENAIQNFITAGVSPETAKKFIEGLGVLSGKRMTNDEVETQIAKTLELLEKNGRGLSLNNRSAIESAITALQVVLEAEKPVVTTIEEDKSVNKTVLSIKVETPNVRITIPAKGRGKANLINKAVRRLLAEKRK